MQGLNRPRDGGYYDDALMPVSYTHLMCIRDRVARYAKAAAHLAKHPDDKDSTHKELHEEQETLLDEIAELKVPLTEVQEMCIRDRSCIAGCWTLCYPKGRRTRTESCLSASLSQPLPQSCPCLLYTSNRMTSLCGICFPGDVVP